VFAPLLIYLGNPTEFTASFVEPLSIYAPYMLAIVGIGGALGAVMTRAGLNRYLSIVSALALLLWLQGNILVWDYGPLDGRSFDLLIRVERGVVDSVIWVSVLFFAIYRHEKFAAPLMQAAAAVLAIQVFSAGISLATNDDLDLTQSDVEENRAAKESIFGFSETRNVVHIVMDGFQSDVFLSILNDPANMSYKEQLQGFTVFQDNLGAYPYTQMTVPALLSGNLYRNHMSVDDFIDSTLAGKTILNSATDAGFEVDIAAPVVLKNVYGKSKHANAYGISRSDHVTSADYIINDSAKLLDLSLFRVLPHFVKALIHRDHLWMFQARIRSESFLHMQYYSDLAFIRELAHDMQISRKEPVYKMMHLMLSHRPTVGNEKCEFDGKRRTNRENVTIQAGCGLKAVLGFLAGMKQLGIYESSLIILMADHGAWVPIENYVPQGDSIDATGVAMATPLLAIKPPGAQGVYSISNAPTSILDVPATIADIMRFDEEFSGDSVFRLDAEQARERLHYTYNFGTNKEHNAYLNPLDEFVISGSPYDPQSWQRVRRYLPEGVVMEVEATD
jgi:hypothetical protein